MMEIMDDYNSTYQFRHALRMDGFHYDKYNGVWVRQNDSRYLAFKYMKKRLRVVDDFNRRSTNYRRNYLKKSSHKDRFRCPYCGRIRKVKDGQVDHIIPVYKAQTKPSYYRMLERYGCNDINDVLNLTIACAYCNKAKSSKTKWWIIRGHLGQSELYWTLIHIIKFLMFCAVILILGSILYYSQNHSVWEIMKHFMKGELII